MAHSFRLDVIPDMQRTSAAPTGLVVWFRDVVVPGVATVEEFERRLAELFGGTYDPAERRPTLEIDMDNAGNMTTRTRSD